MWWWEAATEEENVQSASCHRDQRGSPAAAALLNRVCNGSKKNTKPIGLQKAAVATQWTDLVAALRGNSKLIGLPTAAAARSIGRAAVSQKLHTRELSRRRRYRLIHFGAVGKNNHGGSGDGTVRNICWSKGRNREKSAPNLQQQQLLLGWYRSFYWHSAPVLL